jgi:hypothetical protein
MVLVETKRPWWPVARSQLLLASTLDAEIAPVSAKTISYSVGFVFGG